MKTRSEELLAFLAKRTFLSLWAYPNVFRPSANKRVPAKEVCDVIAVFGDDVIVFSDKECQFPSSSDLDTSWRRWKKRAVNDSIDQLLGAERYLARSSPELYEDSFCTVRLRISLPPQERRRIHLVAIAKVASSKCSDLVGGRGFLGITNKSDSSGESHFFLAQPNDRKFVHVLDDTALKFLLYHLDTAPDLLTYLRRREEFLSRPYTIICEGEHDLFFSYIAETEKFGEARTFPYPPSERFNGIYVLLRGMWDYFEDRDEYKVWRQESLSSLKWDAMIEDFIQDLNSGHFLRGGSTFGEVEEMIRAFAGTSRLERRKLTQLMENAVEDPRMNMPGSMRRSFVISERQTTGFLLLCTNQQTGESDLQYSERRGIMSYTHALVLKYVFPHLEDIVCVTYPSIGLEPFTWAPSYFKLNVLNQEQVKIAKNLHSQGVFAGEAIADTIYDFEKLPVNPSPRMYPTVDFDFLKASET